MDAIFPCSSVSMTGAFLVVASVGVWRRDGEIDGALAYIEEM